MVHLDRKGLFVLKVDLVNFLNWAEQIEKRWGKGAFCELFLSSWIKMLEFLSMAGFENSAYVGAKAPIRDF